MDIKKCIDFGNINYKKKKEKILYSTWHDNDFLYNIFIKFYKFNICFVIGM